MIRIPERAEAQHMQIIGDTGAGKTMIMLQILRQIKHRGDSAIVYDPAREFVQRFYDPKNGDVILNPLDKRCPYWGPAEELRRRSEAKALAVSLFQPPQDRIGEFFIESPQKIFAFLMAYGPTPEELVKWMSDPEEIDRRLKGTEHAQLINPKAEHQRAGVLGSLGLVADSLRLLPKKGEGNGEWSATEWAETRQGWIFITSLPAEREALRPLQSLWIDLLVLRLLNEPKEGQKRAWFVIDELASLQKLPQLHTAITENRKSRNPVILGFQGKAQLEYLYGHLAEVMLSQPATSIWLKTKEPAAGEWVSKFIGKVEIERLRETHFDGSRAGRNFALDRQIEPLVMESEISGLPDLHAYMKYENYVTRFSFPYFDMPVVATDFDLRDTPEDKLPYDPKQIGAAKPQVRTGRTETGAKCAHAAAGKNAAHSDTAARARCRGGRQQPTKPQSSGLRNCHADHFEATFRWPGAELPPEGVHREGTELLVATRRYRRRMARATGRAVRPCRDGLCRGLRETQPGPASPDRRATCAATSVV